MYEILWEKYTLKQLQMKVHSIIMLFGVMFCVFHVSAVMAAAGKQEA